jgi:hypothetical protein
MELVSWHTGRNICEPVGTWVKSAHESTAGWERKEV